MPPTTKKSIQAEQRNCGDHNQVFHHREQVTIANINAGYTLLPNAPRGYKYRIVDMAMIAIGGAAGATTTVDILATQAAASVKLLAVAIAALTQNALVRAGAANASILAGGASYADNDVETSITVNKTGAALTTSTHIEFQVAYVLIPLRSGA